MKKHILILKRAIIMIKVIVKEIWKDETIISEYYFKNDKELTNFVNLCGEDIKYKIIKVA